MNPPSLIRQIVLNIDNELRPKGHYGFIVLFILFNKGSNILYNREATTAPTVFARKSKKSLFRWMLGIRCNISKNHARAYDY